MAPGINNHGLKLDSISGFLPYLFILDLLLIGCVTGTATLTSENSGGFSVTRFPNLNLYSLQCNGSHLPSDVRAVQHISLQKHSPLPNVPPSIIATLSPSDGVRLENSGRGHHNTYVNGVYDVDNLQSTSLTILLSDVTYDDVTYGCTIAYTSRKGELLTIVRTLNITALDIQNMYRVDTTAAEEQVKEEPGVASSTQTHESKPYWNTPMILLIAMASLLFILFIVCLLLVVDRCRENRRAKKRSDRASKKKSNSKEIQNMDQENRPLPPPPTWTYPPGTAVPPYKSPYHRLKLGPGIRTFADDTGYDSDASMIYCRPYDDVGEVIAEKTALETFGKHLPPMYAHDGVLMSNHS